MSNCLDCDQPCQGRYCQDCSAEHSAPDLTRENGDEPECPDCGGRTSGHGVVCYRCRRVDDIVGNMPDDGLDTESTEVAD